jgi:hypothetical protein
LKNDVNVPSKQNNHKKKIFFDGILKVTDEKSRIWSRIRPLVKGTDPHTDPYQIFTDPEHWGEDFYTFKE